MDDYVDAIDFAVVCIDLIGGLVQGLGASLPTSNIPILLDIDLECCRNGDQDVRQSGFALLGDLAQRCTSILPNQASLLSFLEPISENLVYNEEKGVNFSIANNSAWALGELSPLLTHHSLSPLVTTLRQILIKANSDDIDKVYLGNVAVAYARCLKIAPESLEVVQSVIEPWTYAMRSVRNPRELQDSQAAMCQIYRKAALPVPLPIQNLLNKK